MAGANMDIGGGFGAGAAAMTLRDLLAQRAAARMYQDQLTQRAFENSMQERRMNLNEQLHRDQLAQQHQHQADTLALAQQQAIDKRVSMRGIGDPVTEQEYQTETNAGVPTGAYAITPPKVPVATTGFQSLDRGQPGQTVNTPEQGSLLTAPRAITFKGTGAQRATATNEDIKRSQLEQQLSAAVDRANQAWEGLRLKGQNESTLAAYHAAMIDLARTKAEHQQQLSALNEQLRAAQTPQPQFFTDAQGRTRAVIFKNGEMKEIPLPAGYTPTKAAAPGVFEKLSGWLSSLGGGSGDVLSPQEFTPPKD